MSSQREHVNTSQNIKGFLTCHSVVPPQYKKTCIYTTVDFFGVWLHWNGNKIIQQMVTYHIIPYPEYTALDLHRFVTHLQSSALITYNDQVSHSYMHVRSY